MVEMFQALGIESLIQHEAVKLLSGSARGFMRSVCFRERLIKALAQDGCSAIYLSKINTEIESLVEQNLLIRHVKRGGHEIGLNKIIWRLTPETVAAIREATISVRFGSLFPPDDFIDVVANVKIQLRKMKPPRIRVGDTAFELLVSRFSSRPFV